MTPKPELSFRQIWNMCVGFLGIQFAFALQNADVSRIFQTLGANLREIPILWVAAPLSGLIVQPIIGYASDHTWTRLGRRRPYFLGGALLTTVALLWMPDASTLWVAAVMLWLMDASINVSMEPFRAFVGDQLPDSQRPLGFALQSFFIGIGAVLASMLPWAFAKLGVPNVAPAGQIPATVRAAFYVGAGVLFCAMLWTVVSTREYAPERLLSFARKSPVLPLSNVSRAWRPGLVMLVAGGLGVLMIRRLSLEPELYLLAGGLILFGALYAWLSRTGSHGMMRQVMSDLYGMPGAMRRLAWVQFFSWFALFAMWIYTTPTVTSVQFGSSDPGSLAYNTGANWVGVLFAAGNCFLIAGAVVIPIMVRLLGLRWSHLVNLAAGGLGLASFAWVRSPEWLLLSMAGVGFASASIQSLPYTLLSDNLPAEKMGVYMGIFNFFIVIPQMLAASVLGALVHALFGDRPAFGLVLGGISMLIGGLCTLRVEEPRAAEAVSPSAVGAGGA
ncbi:MAG TPA: MFS transporter [Steroidobacteraceae bacterium]|nr:MFS transporter [Steroidobacteraceae bacterium]